MNPHNPLTFAPTPLTILTGFLGAGKTTLLNHILRGEHGLRVAVLVNDFGAINIDSQLVVDVKGETVSLRNGCICCTIRGDLLMSALEVLQRPEPPEYVIVECSGVADPVAVASTFLLPKIRPLIRLDSIVAVVDAEQVHQHEEHQDLISDQIAAADIVLLNKADLASENLRAGLREWIGLIVPNARIVETVHAQVPLELVLGVGRYALRSATAPGEQPRAHDEQFSTWSYQANAPFSFRALQAAFQSLPEFIFRAKGLLYVAESADRQVVAQLVGKRFSLAPGELWGAEPPASQLVLIGRAGALDPNELQQRFDRCLARPDKP